MGRAALSHLKSGPVPCEPIHLPGDVAGLAMMKRSLGPWRGAGAGALLMFLKQRRTEGVSPSTLQNLETSAVFTELYRAPSLLPV